jgi:hypothetical protein
VVDRAKATLLRAHLLKVQRNRRVGESVNGLAKHLERTRGLSPMAAAQLAEKIIRERVERSATKKQQAEAPQMQLGLEGLEPDVPSASDEPDPDLPF